MLSKKILVIDDEKDMTTVVKQMLERTGAYSVRVENDSLKGLAAVAAFKPDLILLDIMMPGMDGPEIARRIAADEATQSIPIIFFTGLLTEREADEGGGFIGNYAVIAKPVTLEKLVAKVEEGLKQNEDWDGDSFAGE